MDLLMLLLILTIIAIAAYYITNKIPDPTLKLIVQLIVLLILLVFFARQTNLIPNVL